MSLHVFILLLLTSTLINTDHANKSNQEQEEILAEARRNLESFGNVPIFVRNLTTAAATLIPDDFLDFVYIDARHDYCGCMEDMVTWWPKLKLGGIMSGHDFVTR